ncbi:MAG: DUF4105 domain-containing protein [Gemmatimonadota bacterium]|nr:DUF4105 domain-containing protein [Gemmatimonadota bacterium]
MRRLGSIPWRSAARAVAVLSLFLAGSHGSVVEAQEPTPELRVWLITIGPGTAIWERFGHNALRVVDTRTGYDASYNWGIFDFEQEDFVPRFLRGQMLYMMAPFASEPMLEMYRSAGREIVAQELDLTPEQKRALRDFAERNALPENREYRYDYFLDNCSTRVRDLLDRVLGGALFEQFGEEPTGTSYRYHTRRLTRPDPVLFTGMDLLLGSPGDRPITRWAEMFIPMTLRDAVREVRIDHGGGELRPLVKDEEVVVKARVAEAPDEPPAWGAWYLMLGLFLGGGLAHLGRRAGVGSRRGAAAFGVVGTLWAFLAGTAGTILVLVLFTDHAFMAWNENLFFLNPVALLLVPLIPLSLVRDRVPRLARGTALFLVGASVLEVVLSVTPLGSQLNWLEAMLFIPIHVGLWWGLESVGATAGGDEANADRR